MIVPAASFPVTGLGSVPLAEAGAAMKLALDHFPEIPFWPQLSRRGPWEDILLQFTAGFPGILVNPERRTATVSADFDRPTELTAYYQAVMDNDLDRFALSPETAPGFFALVETVNQGRPGLVRAKGQVVGPVLFCQGVKDAAGRPVIHDEELRTVYAEALGLAGAWQARELIKANPELDKPLIMIDDPGFYMLGSAYLPLAARTAADMLDLTVEPIRRAGALVGVHCCANTDWAALLSTQVDLVSFDAADFGDEFVIYGPAAAEFIDRGGRLAWGAVPTKNFRGDETASGLTGRLIDLMGRLVGQGVDRTRLIDQSWITPACGCGGLTVDQTTTIFDLVRRVRETVIDRLGRIDFDF